MSDGPLDEDEPDEGASPKKNREKAQVLVELYKRKKGSGSLIVTSKEIQAIITELGLGLGTANTANFLKDIIRRLTANDVWPAELKTQRITARQRFGKRRVLEFIDYLPGFDEPFPDRFEATPETPIFDLQAVSLPSVARRLGREDETWLAQIVVNLRIVESQLAFRSSLSDRLLDIVPLQIGMKTQPEIDATYIVTAQSISKGGETSDEHIFLTCEVKGKKERLLEDQIRFQVHQAFRSTEKLSNPPINAVKPFAIRVIEHATEAGMERLIHVVEFETIFRNDYAALWPPASTSRRVRRSDDDTPVYSVPLVKGSDALYRVHPKVRGLSYK